MRPGHAMTPISFVATVVMATLALLCGVTSAGAARQLSQVLSATAVALTPPVIKVTAK